MARAAAHCFIVGFEFPSLTVLMNKKSSSKGENIVQWKKNWKMNCHQKNKSVVDRKKQEKDKIIVDKNRPYILR